MRRLAFHGRRRHHRERIALGDWSQAGMIIYLYTVTPATAAGINEIGQQIQIIYRHRDQPNFCYTSTHFCKPADSTIAFTAATEVYVQDVQYRYRRYFLFPVASSSRRDHQ